MRRNFVHNCIVHPFCGLVWLAADIAGVLGLPRLKGHLVAFGEKIHKTCA